MKSLRVTLYFIAAILLGLGSSALTHAATVSTDEDGVVIDAGGMGTFNVSYPELEGGAPHKIIAKTPAGKIATIQYDGGANLRVDVSDPSQIVYTFAGVPADVKQAQIVMMIEFSYQQGGKWKIDATNGSFPVEKPAKPHLYQGNASTFELTDAQDESLSLHIPDYGYIELCDNREWNWAIYALHTHFPLQAGNPTYKIALSTGAPAGTKRIALVDPFGQIKAGDWPGKVQSEAELKADAESEKAYYASLTPPQRDSYGGLPNTKDKLGLTASGFFHVEKKGEKWILVDPDGNAFFHLGICAFAPGDDYTLVAGRESTYEWLPPLDGEFKTAYKPDSGNSVLSFYLTNTIRKYGVPYDLDAFQTRMIDRVRKFGFNSIGAFSPASAAVKTENFPYVGHLPLSAWGKDAIPRIPGIGETWDPFDPANVARVDRSFAAELPAKANDPLLIGYFLVNEPLYEDIPKVVPGLKGSDWACKRVLVQQLSDKYKTIDAFNTAWGTSAKSFGELNDTPLPVNTKEASGDMHDFTGTFFETYFKLVADTFHKYDTHHMLIGNRLQPGTINNEQLCRIAGKYLDIMSYNYYTNGVDKDFLNRIYSWTGRPMILSEFYWVASHESGLVGGNDVGTQQNRGLAYRNYVDQSASLGYVVGIEWFTLMDQASTGRWFTKYSGERANTGLFSVADRPYKPMIAEMMKANDDVYGVWLDGKAPYAFDDPKFAQVGHAQNIATAPHSTGPIKIDGTTQNWPGIPPNVISGKRLVIGNAAEGLEGTFKLCWDDDNLYVLVSVVDPTPMMSKVTADNLWSGDGIELFIGTEKLDEGGPLIFSDRHLIVGAPGPGKAPFYYDNSPKQYETGTLIVPGGDGKSYTLETAIPWTALGIKPQPGLELLFDLGIDDSSSGTGRRAQLMWNGTDKNSGDRTHWGRLKLLQ